jgi:LacI family transcriptional regulator
VEVLGSPVGPNQIAFCDAWSIAEGAKAMTGILADRVPHTAVLAGNDLLALGAFEALTAAGLRCPEDVSVVGFNDMPFMDKVTPALTTVTIPHYDIGSEAARLLLELIGNPVGRPRSLLLPVQIVVRASTSAARR